jgi:hypothetical protein
MHVCRENLAPPTIVFARQRMKVQLTDGALLGTNFTRNMSGISGLEPALGIPRCLAREAIRTWTVNQHYCAWTDFPVHRHGKLFISGPCMKRDNDLLKLNRHQLKMVVAILTGHAAVRIHLLTMSLFEGDPTCRFCRKEAETEQHTICHCETLARRRFNVLGNPIVEPNDISTVSVRDLCLFIRGTGLLKLC